MHMSNTGDWPLVKINWHVPVQNREVDKDMNRHSSRNYLHHLVHFSTEATLIFFNIFDEYQSLDSHHYWDTVDSKQTWIV